jgi:CheY-like chemotaxis protein
MKTILVVDDFDVIRNSILNLLERFGFNTLSARNGAEALEVLESNSPDLILLDVTMPVMDGITFLTKLRSDGLRSSMPIILLTGHGDEKSTKAAKLGVSGFLEKASFSVSELMEKISDILKLDLETLNSESKVLIERSKVT